MAKKNKDAETDYDQNSLFREINEDVERERMIRFWKVHGLRILAVSLVAVALVAGWEGWRYHRIRTAEQQAVHYADGLNRTLSNPMEADAVFGRLIELDDSGFALLSRFQMASQKLNAGADQSAFEELRAIGADETVPQPFRNLANTALAYHLLDVEGAEAEIEDLMIPLSAEDSMWRGSAREILALKAVRNKNLGRAKELLIKNKDDAMLPESFTRRASEFLSVM